MDDTEPRRKPRCAVGRPGPDRCRRRADPSFECECGASLCSAHRYPEAHDCRAAGAMRERARKRHAQAMPRVVADRISQI